MATWTIHISSEPEDFVTGGIKAAHHFENTIAQTSLARLHDAQFIPTNSTKDSQNRLGNHFVAYTQPLATSQA